MATIYATLITLIFAAWIWDLKHRVAILEHSCTVAGFDSARAPESKHETHRRAAPHHHPDPTPQRSAPVATATMPSHGVSRHNGVPTWVIE